MSNLSNAINYKHMFNKVRIRFFLVCILIMPFIVNAQPPSIDEDPLFGVEDVHVPFDDGVWLLIGGAIVYGLFLARQYKRKEKIGVAFHR